MSATRTTNVGVELDRRDVLALTQYLTVLDDLPRVDGNEDRYVVISESGSEYLVDRRDGSCSCPDYRYREVRCKHIRRVEFATGARPIPAGIDGVDPDLGRHIHAPEDSDTDLAAEFPTGAVVRDHDDHGGLMRVLRVRYARADIYEIEPGTTVADCNPDSDPADYVVEVVYEGDLDRKVPGWREWPAADLSSELAAYREEWGVDVRTYAFPHSRIEVVSR